MKDWKVEYDFAARTGGSMTFAAETRDEAESLGFDYVRETFPEAFDIEIVEVDEI